MSNGTQFSTAAGRRVIKSETDKRVSEDAAVELLQDLEGYGRDVTVKAQEIAEHAGRKTVRGSDVKEAIRQLR